MVTTPEFLGKHMSCSEKTTLRGKAHEHSEPTKKNPPDRPAHDNWKEEKKRGEKGTGRGKRTRRKAWG